MVDEVLAVNITQDTNPFGIFRKLPDQVADNFKTDVFSGVVYDTNVPGTIQVTGVDLSV
jgi:hypothetical protein